MLICSPMNILFFFLFCIKNQSAPGRRAITTRERTESGEHAEWLIRWGLALCGEQLKWCLQQWRGSGRTHRHRRICRTWSTLCRLSSLSGLRSSSSNNSLVICVPWADGEEHNENKVEGGSLASPSKWYVPFTTFSFCWCSRREKFAHVGSPSRCPNFSNISVVTHCDPVVSSVRDQLSSYNNNRSLLAAQKTTSPSFLPFRIKT